MAVTDSNFAQVEAGPTASQNGWKSGAELDAGPWRSVCYTIRVAGKAVDWRVFGAHAEDFGDEMKLYDETVDADECDAYTVSPPPYRYYRVKVKSANPSEPGTVTVVGMAKAG